MAADPRPTVSVGPLLTLRLHDTPLIAARDGQQTVLERRAAALCALAALQPGFPREMAAAWIWPDSGDGRRNLRQQLLRFKRQHGHAVLAGDERLFLAEGVVFEDSHEVLPGHTYEDCDEFARWLQTQRHVRRHAHLAELRQALADAEATGDLPAAQAAAEALVAAEPDSEEALRELMRVHYLRADTAAGLAVHQRLAQMMASTHGARPSAATEQLALALRQAQPAAAPTLRRISPTLLRPPRTVGRARELQSTLDAWSAQQAVLLMGEAGMGKSRLIADCCAGTAVLGAAGRPGDTGSPYATLARLLRPLQAVAEQVLDAAARSQLAPMLPLPAAPVAPPRPGALEQAAAELLQRAGVSTVAVDDLHFADAASLDLLAALAAQAPAGQRWIFALRPGESGSAAQALQDTLEATHRLVTLSLAPLDEAAMAELVDTLAIDGLDSRNLAPALVRHTGGNPLFALETLKQGLAEGSLIEGRLPRAGAVGALIERRLRRLSEPALALARVAAIAGVDFNIELAEAVIGVRAVDLATAWDELQQAQVLRDEAFAHDLVADAVMRGLPAAVARRLHAECAAWIQAHGGDPARVARHWQSSGRLLEAAAAFVQAALRARAAGRQAETAELQGQAATAYGEAGRRAERFEALAQRVTALIGARADEAAVAEARTLADSATDDLQRARAARVLTELLSQRGPFEEAISIGRTGIALARAAGAQEELVRVVSATAGTLLKIGGCDEAYSMMLPLRDWVEGCGDDNLRFIWYGYWGATLGSSGRLREAVAAYDTALAAAECAGDRPSQSKSLLNQCIVLRTMGALDRACEASRRGLALTSDDPGDLDYRLARLVHARDEAESGEFASALEVLEDVLPQFETMGAPFWLWATRGALARIWQHLGQHARAMQALHQAPDNGFPAWMQAALVWTGLEVAQWRSQRIDEAQVQRALAMVDGDAYRRHGNRVRGLRFALPADVLAQSGALADLARRYEQFGVLAALHLHEARAAIFLGQPSRAQQAAQVLVALLDDGYAPESTYLPEAWLACAEAFDFAGDSTAARQACTAGAAWIQTRALPRVPPPFIDSFLQRNPVNQRLLAMAVRSST